MKILFFLGFFSHFFSQTPLEEFWLENGYDLKPSGTAVYEGYISPPQRELFILELQKHPEIHKIAEVGFNAGHTSEIFLESVKDSQVTSFDINSHAYTVAGVQFLQEKYKERFHFIEGDSQISVPNYYRSHQDETFDLIYIDGGHLFTLCFHDILHFKTLAHPNSILWIDDINFPEVKKAVELAQRLRIIEVIYSKSVEDDCGIRAWSEARYLF